ncbi:uncharacterized protein LOC134717934 [Mytilus trossulus]|uniref:uncharacterized protein LOC134717934 n=1 Tax=Mytilus trossulus TaxID=6551 RepID=UPI0030073CD7
MNYHDNQVIQKRFDGYLSFDRTWKEYKSGFGSASEEYWLGNDNIHQISTSTSHKLSIYLEDFTGSFKYANYSHFIIGDELRKYQLRIDGPKVTAGLGDYLTATQNTYLFTTKDQDNDIYGSGLNCAVKQGGGGGWWYSNCANVNLNGPYLAGPGTNQTAMFCVETVKECLDAEICGDDEVCFTQKYQTRLKQELYDLGCSLQQVIQRRFDGNVSFDRTWEEYKRGFGSVSSEYWLGKNLSFQMADYLTSSHNTYMFTTKDQDNDNIDYNCAVYEGGNGGWWYSSCVIDNLN